MLSTLNLTVTTLADPSGPTGTVSLRQAINTANADTIDSQEIINFVAGLHGTIDLTQALPNLAHNISINGPGAASLTVQRDTSATPFSVFTVNSGETVSISGITITGGNATSGGGIFNGGALAVTNCTIIGNTASGGSLYGNGQGYVTSSFYGGGAIYSTTGSVITIANGTFTGNTTNGDGGGIYTSGTATVTNSVFTANEAACAGGIFNNGVLTVNNSTFANSTGAFYGGGIWNDSEDTGAGGLYQYATLTVTNSTFSHNAVNGWASAGGGICGNGRITVSNSTFANNSTNGLYNKGGGIYGNMTINNTIVAGNTGYDISGQITGDHNLIGDGAGITNLAQLGASNIIGTTVHPINPLLGPLQDNGGPTQTMALLPGSPAIDTGSNAIIPAGVTTDQRGTGFPRILNGTVDIGAYESTPNFINGQTINFVAIANQTYGVTPITLSATDTSSLPVSFSVISGPATITGSVLTVTGMGNVVVEASQAGNATYAAATPVDKSFTVSPALLTITANNDGKTYGTLKTFSGTVFTKSGLVNGDTITNVTEASTGAATSATVGTYNIVPSAATGNRLSNYTITYINGTLTVNAAPLTITANNATKMYGAPLPLLGVSYSGFVNGDTAANLTTPPTLATTATASSHVFTGGYPITASGASDPNYTISYQPVTLTITAAPLTITANNAAKIYGAELPVLAASYSGFVNGDTAGSLITPPTVSTTASSASHVGSYAINASGASDPDYYIIYVGGTLIVTPAPLTITGDSKTTVYGSGMPALTASYSGWLNEDSPASLASPPVLSTTAIASSHVGSYAINATGAASSDYIISYVGGTLIVTPAPLTITVNNVTKVYGAVMPTLTASYSGLVNGDTVASLGQGTNLLINGDFSLGNTGFTSQLDYIPISGSTTGSDYDVVHNPSVDFWSAFGNFGDHTTGTGLMFAANASSTPNTVAWDEMVNVSKAEDYVFSGWAASMGQYPIGNPVDPSPARLGVFVNGIQVGSAFQIPAQNGQWGQFAVPWYSGTSDFATIRIVDLNTDGIGNDFTLDDLVFSAPSSPGGASLATTATASSHVGSYAITASGAASSDYTISYAGGTLTVTPAALTVTATSESKTYGQTASLAYAENGLVNSDTITSVTENSVGAASTAPVGSDPITISNAVGTGLNNYTVTYVNGTLTVTSATLTVTATSIPSKVYEMTATLTYTTAGLVNGNKVTNVTETSAGAASTSNVGSYPITSSNAVGTGLSNYNINYVDGTLTVTPATASVVVTPYSVTYNGQPHTVSGKATDVNGVALPASDLNLTGTTHINAGVYTDTWTFTDASGNYLPQSGTVTDIITNPSPIALVTTLYQEILGRTPDTAGLTCWVNAVNSGATVNSIVTSFWNSPEHLANPIGNLNTATYDADNAFVSAIYHDVLGRAGDTGGITSWDQVLNSNNVTPNQVAMDFWNSSEHLTEQWAGYAPASTYGVVVDALYTELLGRSPDLGGLNAWVNIQYSGALTQDQMVQDFANSTEFGTRTNSLSTNQCITFLYNNVLNRAPDAAGLAAWDQALNSGTVTRTQAVQGFWDSPEHAQEL